ncbi:MAG: GH92 family glycosyl hydrolase, partial [Bacteroidia bacterium]|nr:GH92 family glycosyl hydrolase [Bacteroidia bacterium]
KHSAMLDHLGLDAYKKNGVISMDDEHESVSKTLEYAYDDWCIAQIAKLTDNGTDYDYFMKRSQSWKNTYDIETGFMRPRKNGGWLSPFDPKEVNNNFTEGNSWQYTFFVPQDIFGLIKKMGGPIKFESKLDELFSTSSKTTGREQADITGLIGQYAHGNEPSHHMAYLYNFISKPSKTQSRVNQILNDFYKNDPDGLIGNEDCGQMSAWYVLSSLGFYQVTPGTNKYILGTPLFKEVKVHLENGKTFNVKSNKISKDDFYVQSIKIKITPHPSLPKDIELSDNWSSFNHINYESIIDGATLEFEMSEKATIKQTIGESVYVLENSPLEKIITVPSIKTTSNIFDDSLRIEILSDSEVNYAIVINNNDKKKFTYYKGPFTIYSTQKIFAYSENDHYYSDTIHGTFYKRPNNWDIKIISKYNPQYTAGGDKGIIDGVHGETNWRKGEWQGYQSQDFECIIDLKKEQTVSSFSSSYLQDTRAWIVMPTKVEYYTSADNVNFKLAGSISNKVEAKDYEVQMQNLELKAEPTKARYIKIKAYNYGKLPEWHQGAGGDTFIFIDEIDIK